MGWTRAISNPRGPSSRGPVRGILQESSHLLDDTRNREKFNISSRLSRVCVFDE